MRAAAFSLNIDDIVTGGEPAGVAVASSVAANRFRRRVCMAADGRYVGRFGSQGGGRVNDGLNIAALGGTPVIAAAPGTVVYSGNEIGVFGGLVLIDHGGGWITAYGHLGSLSVAQGRPCGRWPTYRQRRRHRLCHPAAAPFRNPQGPQTA